MAGRERERADSAADSDSCLQWRRVVCECQTLDISSRTHLVVLSPQTHHPPCEPLTMTLCRAVALYWYLLTSLASISVVWMCAACVDWRRVGG